MQGLIYYWNSNKNSSLSLSAFIEDFLPSNFQGYGVPEDKQSTTVPFVFEDKEYTLKHGSVVIAAITSCTNTSNPSVMLGAGMRFIMKSYLVSSEII